MPLLPYDYLHLVNCSEVVTISDILCTGKNIIACLQIYIVLDVTACKSILLMGKESFPMSRIDLQALLRYVCHLITEIDGNFVIILNFISLRGLSISIAISYI